MKVLIVYYSAYQNHTKKIAEIFANRTDAELVDIKSAKDINLDHYDLIGFGSGVYRESIAPQLIHFAENLILFDKEIFVFSTSGVGMRYYNNKLIKLLKAKGAVCKGSFACRGSFVSKDFSDNKMFEFMSRFAANHPNAKDFLKAEKFISKIVK
jgi:flavodoxin